MKRILFVLAVLISGFRLPAQTNAPVRLALIAESQEASAAADVLTAELSTHKNLQLLERNEIEKVYREQGLSAGNKDYLKLGQILGADGLLLFNVVKTSQATNLTVRLIAVKPGVVLLDENFPWPLRDMVGWSPLFAHRLDPFFSKLAVLVKDAIPISVVNLRSATTSTEGAETERQLKLLTIQRLSQEKELFVLERQKMQLLSVEKDLKLDDSAFWNGSYLLEGVVDQNGYSQATMTINARLIPPKGGTPLLMEVSGSRTNPVEVINRLAVKVNELLKINSSVKEWNATEEARQYFDEAKWALRWDIYSEAQMAAESAWALGNRDMECAIIRIKAYASSADGMIVEMQGVDRLTVDSGEESDRDMAIRQVKKISDEHPGAVFKLDAEGIDSVVIDNSPAPQKLDRVIRALNFYREFSQTLPPDEPKINSAWYGLGVESLTTAAQVLQHYYLVPKSQAPVVDKLEELRTLARTVAAWISKSPSVHDSYFVVDPNPDTERRIVMNKMNIYLCEANWGCFWQEKPEDAIALYRYLLSSPAFACFNNELDSSRMISCSCGLECPRLIAWQEGDRQRLLMIWDSFVQELSDSTNQFLKAEAMVFKRLDVSGLNETEIITKYNEYWHGIKSGKRDTLAIEAQKQYLQNFCAYNYDEFEKTFEIRDYSKSQALKIAPLLTAYRSNLVAQIGELNVSIDDAHRHGRVDHAYLSDSDKKQNTQTAIVGVDQLQTKLDAILGFPSPKPAEPTAARTVNSELANANQPTLSSNILAKDHPAVTRSLLVNHFFNMPQEQLWAGVFIWPGKESSHGISNERILTHRWRDGRLLLNLKYDCTYLNQAGDNYVGGTLGAAALLDPENGHWDVIVYPKGRVREYGSVEFFHGNLYLVVDDQSILGGNQAGHNESILKFDLKTGQWETLDIQISGTFKQTAINQVLLQLFTVNDHLYAANFESIFEITEDGHGTHILASTRRRPAASTLDLSDSLGSPVLYSGPNNSLCAIIGNGIYVLDEKDWKMEASLNSSALPEMFEDAIFFRSISHIPWNAPQTLWILQKNRFPPELALYKTSDRPAWAGGASKSVVPPPKTLWPFPATNFLVRTAATSFKSDLYFFIDHSLVTTVDGHKTAVDQDGYHAKLVCLSRDCLDPIIVPLKFDAQRGPLPIENLYHNPWNPWNASGEPDQSASWLFFADNYLFIGEEDISGAWVVPISEIKTAIAAQKQLLLDKKTQ